MDTTKLSKETQVFLRNNLTFWDSDELPLEVIKGMIGDIDDDLKLLDPDEDKALIDKFKRVRKEIEEL